MCFIDFLESSARKDKVWYQNAPLENPRPTHLDEYFQTGVKPPPSALFWKLSGKNTPEKCTEGIFLDRKWQPPLFGKKNERIIQICGSRLPLAVLTNFITQYILLHHIAFHLCQGVSVIILFPEGLVPLPDSLQKLHSQTIHTKGHTHCAGIMLKSDVLNIFQ